MEKRNSIKFSPNTFITPAGEEIMEEGGGADVMEDRVLIVGRKVCLPPTTPFQEESEEE